MPVCNAMFLIIFLKVHCHCPLGSITNICSLSTIAFMGAEGGILDLKSQPVLASLLSRSSDGLQLKQLFWTGYQERAANSPS